MSARLGLASSTRCFGSTSRLVWAKQLRTPLSTRWAIGRVRSAGLTTAAESQAVPPRRPLLVRFLIVSLIGIGCTSLGANLATRSVRPLWKEMQQPLSDADTVAMFRPGDPDAEAINTHLVEHPLAQSLRHDPDLSESRPHMRIPQAMRAHHLTAGTMRGPHKLEVPPLVFSAKDGDAVTALLHVGDDLCGQDGMVHSGAVATIMDEGLARSAFQSLPNNVAMTAGLNLTYLEPIPANSYLVLRGHTVKVEGRKSWIEGQLELLSDDDTTSKVFVQASGLFVEPKGAKRMKRMFGRSPAG